MSFRILILVCLWFVFSFGEAQENRPPNFVFIMADDLGYGDLGCFGAKKIKTPHIDALAAEGMKLTTFYAASPICTPTRASFLTGKYPSRHGLGTPLHTTDDDGLAGEEVTLSEILKKRGYATACIGKWHLGHEPEFYPTRHGFDFFYGTPLGHCFAPEAKRKDGQVSDLFLRDENKIAFPAFENLTRDLTFKAVQWIKERKDEPFFLFLSHPMPHTPLAVSDQFRGKSEGGLYGNVCEELDWSVGEILIALKKLELEDNTIVAFTSDNGGETEASNAPFRGRKQQPLEGGIRVPCVVRWPGKIPAGATCDELTTIMDFLPTFADLAYADLPDGVSIDGKNISPLLLDEADATSPHEAFIYHARFGKLAGIRVDDWKLLVPCDARTWRQKTVALYDLASDPREERNMAEANPEVVADLRKRLENFGGKN